MIATTIQRLVELGDAIKEDRREKLDAFAEWMAPLEGVIDLVFICTHNSRRSHLGQVWAAVGAAHFGIDGVQTWSGGTETTACNIRTINALRRAGLEVSKHPGPTSDNPKYLVAFNAACDPCVCFSKRYDDAHNPSQGFAAIMTCTNADTGCPRVKGCAKRWALPYVDPKEGEGTDNEDLIYDQRSDQIGAEMMYLFKRVRDLRQG